MSTSGTASSTRPAATHRRALTTKVAIRRLRTGDGVYFTKFGARKLAHYVEREIQRITGNKGLPVALPMPVDPPAGAGQAGRPRAAAVHGPVVAVATGLARRAGTN